MDVLWISAASINGEGSGGSVATARMRDLLGPTVSF
jgi:hypothetical protein